MQACVNKLTYAYMVNEPPTDGASSKITGVTVASAKVSPKVEEAFSFNPFIKLNHKEFPNAAANMTSPIVNQTPHRLFLQVRFYILGICIVLRYCLTRQTGQSIR